MRCHGADEPDGGLDFTSSLAEDGLLTSYHTMFGARSDQTTRAKRLVACSDRFSNADITRPMQFGSHKSPLVRVLLDDDLHRKEVSLDPAEMFSIVTWVDANAPYFDRFLNKRPGDGGDAKREVSPEFSTTLE